MTTKIQKWGNSLAMRLPKELADSFNLKAGSQISFTTSSDGFTVRPKIKIKVPKYTLEELVAGITPKNRHKLIWPDDKPRGKEVW